MSVATRPVPADRPLSLGPASRLLGVDPDTLRRWADEGRIDAFTTAGGHRRFDRSTLERILEARRHDATIRLATPRRDDRSPVARYRRGYSSGAEADDVRRRDPRRRSRGLPRRRPAPRRRARRPSRRDRRRRSRRGRERAPIPATDELAEAVSAARIASGRAVSLFVAARRPFLTELGAIARRRSLDPDRLVAIYDELIGPPRSAADAPGRAVRPTGGAATRRSAAAARVRCGRPDVPGPWLAGITALLAFVFAIALLDQWRERRQASSWSWAVGMLLFGIGSGWRRSPAHSAGAIRCIGRGTWPARCSRAAWLGLGTAMLLARTRFGYTYAALLLLSGLLALLIRNSPNYAGAGPLPILYLWSRRPGHRDRRRDLLPERRLDEVRRGRRRGLDDPGDRAPR